MDRTVGGLSLEMDDRCLRQVHIYAQLERTNWKKIAFEKTV